jgi:hypothetical protein
MGTSHQVQSHAPGTWPLSAASWAFPLARGMHPALHRGAFGAD